MGLRDDIEVMERYERAGLLREWFEGTAPQLSEIDRLPPDPSAVPCKSSYAWISRRGD